MPKTRHPSILRRIRAVLVAVSFIIVITLPSITLLMQSDLAITAFPSPRSLTGAKNYPKELKQYFAASVELRGTLAGWHSSLKTRINGPSQVSGVTVGKDGWLYLEWMLSSRDYRIQDPVDYDQLIAWRDDFERNQAVCAELKIPYLVVLVPLKQNIYAEYLPDLIAARIGSDSGSDHMFRFLNAKSIAVQPLAVLADLQANKFRGPLFYKTDTHWNSLGAFVASRAICERLQTDFPSLKIPAYEGIIASTNLVSGGIGRFRKRKMFELSTRMVSR